MKIRLLVVAMLGAAVSSPVTLGSIPPARAQETDRDEAGAANQTEVDAVKAVKERHQASLLSKSGVLGVGVGLTPGGRVGIVVFVQKGAPRPAIPAQADGVPIAVVESGGFVAHDGPCDVGTCHEEVEALPVRMGTSTGNVNGTFAGTLGYRVRRIGEVNEVGYITNNHVASASGGRLCPAQINPARFPAFGLDQCQPGLLDAPGSACSLPKIGDLVQVVPLVMGPAFLNTVDAAFVRSNRACVSRTIRDIGDPSSNVKFPKLGTTLKMSGRSSGFRLVMVSAVNVMVDVNYGAGCGVARFVNQAVTVPVTGGAASRPGDSGSPVTTSGKAPRGLNFAGDGFHGLLNPMPLVLSALGVEIDTAKDDVPAPGQTCP